MALVWWLSHTHPQRWVTTAQQTFPLRRCFVSINNRPTIQKCPLSFQQYYHCSSFQLSPVMVWLGFLLCSQLRRPYTVSVFTQHQHSTLWGRLLWTYMCFSAHATERPKKRLLFITRFKGSSKIIADIITNECIFKKDENVDWLGSTELVHCVRADESHM